MNILITLYPSDRLNYPLPESFVVNPASEYIIQEQEIQDENTFLRESYAGLLFYSCWNITDRDLYVKCNDTSRYYYFLEEFDESTQAYRINLNSLSLPEFTPEILYLNLKTKELTKISFEEARNFVNSDFGAYFDHSYGAQKVYEEGVGKDYFSIVTLCKLLAGYVTATTSKFTFWCRNYICRNWLIYSFERKFDRTGFSYN